MPKLECEVCLGDIEHYYDLSLDVVGLNNKLCNMVTSNPSNANLFGPGRVVILRDGVGYLPTTALVYTDNVTVYSILREATSAFCSNQICGKQVHPQESCFSCWLWSIKRLS